MHERYSAASCCQVHSTPAVCIETKQISRVGVHSLLSRAGTLKLSLQARSHNNVRQTCGAYIHFVGITFEVGLLPLQAPATRAAQCQGARRNQHAA